jgi:hypothetical protein
MRPFLSNGSQSVFAQKFLLISLVSCTLASQAAPSPHTPHTPGTLANAGFEGQPMKSMFFFPGQWRGVPGEAFYAGPDPAAPPLAPATNAWCNYTILPIDGWMNLGWSDNVGGEKRGHAVDLMLAAGVNVVNMSYWGPPNVDRWAFWAPMHTAPGANEELFDQTIGRPVLIAPYIEDGNSTQDNEDTPDVPDDRVTQLGCPDENGLPGAAGPTGQSPGYRFAATFPGSATDPAPQLVEQIVDLIDRFLLQPKNAAWPAKWAQMYDRDGKPRYVVSLIHVGSDQIGVTDESFAKGFGWVADRVYALRGVRVGFTLDALPPDHPASFKPSPKRTGPLLAKQRAVLAIQSFIPEVFRGIAAGLCREPGPDGSNCDAPGEPHDGSPQLTKLIEWKRDYVSAWVNTGIPVILDVSSGYDARNVFRDTNPPRYGNNEPWRFAQRQMLDELDVRGITGNAWNGYTEALAFVPSCTAGPPDLPFCDADAKFTDGRKAFDWFRALTPSGGTPARLPARLTVTSPATAVYSDPVTLELQLTSFDLNQALFSHPPVRTAVGRRVVSLILGKQKLQVRTDDRGIATATLTIDQRPDAVPAPLLVSFNGDDDYLAVEAPRSSVRVLKESTSVRWFGEVGPTHRDDRILAAQLLDDDGQSVRKRTVVFTLTSEAGVEKCSGVTDTGGIARCKIRGRVAGSQTISMVFGGDAYYEPASSQR